MKKDLWIKEDKLSLIIQLCNEIEIDGETTQYILRAIDMEEQMLRQLIRTMPLSIVYDELNERTDLEI
jgi:hypothetical protein